MSNNFEGIWEYFFANFLKRDSTKPIYKNKIQLTIWFKQIGNHKQGLNGRKDKLNWVMFL
jgi:hypothetical protein